jgi:hypothetical protein
MVSRIFDTEEMVKLKRASRLWYEPKPFRARYDDVRPFGEAGTGWSMVEMARACLRSEVIQSLASRSERSQSPLCAVGM